jgi:RES domain
MKQFLENRDMKKLNEALVSFKNYIVELGSEGLNDQTFVKIDAFCKREIGFFPFLYEMHNLEKNKPFYRVRINDNSFNRDLITSYEMPPAACVKNFQRLNIPGNPVFYSATTMDVAVFETFYNDHSKIGNDFFISEWQPPETLNVLSTAFLFSDNIKSDLNTASKTIMERTEHLREGLNKEQTDFMIELLKYLTNEFLNPNSYVLSSFIGHNQIFAPHELKTQMFLYPSVKKKHNGINVVFHPEFMRKHLTLTRVFHCRATNILEDNIQIELSEVGEIANGVLVWRNITDEDLKYVKTKF